MRMCITLICIYLHAHTHTHTHTHTHLPPVEAGRGGREEVGDCDGFIAGLDVEAVPETAGTRRHELRHQPLAACVCVYARTCVRMCARLNG